VDVLIALGVLGVLGVVVVGFVRWARGGAPYDDGTGATYVPYVPEPSLDESAPPPGVEAHESGPPPDLEPHESSRLPEPDHEHERRDDGGDE